MNNWDPTHQSVATELKLTVATVSRIRTGARMPSITTMRKITQLTGWTLTDQNEAMERREYPYKLNLRLKSWDAERQPVGE